ncbi:helix-turn-helix domain-containing protein [Komagataeibacter oboediens]
MQSIRRVRDQPPQRTPYGRHHGARECGVYKARRPSIDYDQIHAMNAKGISPTEIARRLGIGRTSVYRCLGKVAG